MVEVTGSSPVSPIRYNGCLCRRGRVVFAMPARAARLPKPIVRCLQSLGRLIQARKRVSRPPPVVWDASHRRARQFRCACRLALRLAMRRASITVVLASGIGASQGRQRAGGRALRQRKTIALSYAPRTCHAYPRPCSLRSRTAWQRDAFRPRFAWRPKRSPWPMGIGHVGFPGTA